MARKYELFQLEEKKLSQFSSFSKIEFFFELFDQKWKRFILKTLLHFISNSRDLPGLIAVQFRTENNPTTNDFVINRYSIKLKKCYIKLLKEKQKIISINLMRT